MPGEEEKRLIDAQITTEFLNNAGNREIVTRIIQVFHKELQEQLKQLPGGFSFYLKGGNAVALLKGEEPAGDYDFQLTLSPARYKNWSWAINWLDPIIINAMVKAMDVVKGQFDETAFEVATLQGWANEPGTSMYGIDLNDIVRLGRQDYIRYIGSSYGALGYADIVSLPQYNGRSLVLKGGEIYSTSFQKRYGPMISVNYVIPDFVLYRMAYSYGYQDRTGRRFALKSEIIDVSVPRLDSAECFLSQEGVVTHFRPSKMGFVIPGWGYHFYENINLLQEIYLGVSSSPDKKRKRQERGQMAMEELRRVNPGGLGQMFLDEPGCDGKTGKILGYLGALLFNFGDYREFNGGRALFHTDAVKCLAGMVIGEAAGCLSAAISGDAEMELDSYVQYRLYGAFEPRTKLVKEVRKMLAGIFSQYNKTKEKKDGMQYGVTYQYLSPFTEVDEDGFFPTDYAVVAVKEEVYLKFRDYMRSVFSEDMKEFEEAFLLPLSCMGYRYFMIFQQSHDWGCRMGEHLPEFLQRSILESHRYPLVKALMRVQGNQGETG